MSAFKRLLQEGIKVENCLARFRVLKRHSTSGTSPHPKKGTPISESALMESLVQEGFTKQQAEGIVKTIMDLHDSFTEMPMAPKMESFVEQGSTYHQGEGVSETIIDLDEAPKANSVSSLKSKIDELSKEKRLKLDKIGEDLDKKCLDIESKNNDKQVAAVSRVCRFSCGALIATSTIVLAVYCRSM